MKFLENLFKDPAVAVLSYPASSTNIIQQIHDEFDSAYDRETQEVDSILGQLSIPKESAIEHKGGRLAALGFTKSVIVEKAKDLRLKREEVIAKADMLKSEAELLRTYQAAYSFQKILTLRELKRICEKYKLIYAPVSAYKMDVPEKNLLDIERAKKIEPSHVAPSEEYIEVIFATGEVKRFKQPPQEIPDRFADERDWVRWSTRNAYTSVYDSARLTDTMDTVHSNLYQVLTVSNTGFYICAPASEFDTTGLFRSDFGYINATTLEIKDPIVFDFLKGGICRVITKWGLEAKDEALVNPVEN